jgi:rubredoxin
MPDGENKLEKLTWKCSNCGYTMAQDRPPDRCSSCGAECEFLNVSCYTPDCGGPEAGTFDPRLGKKDVK